MRGARMLRRHAVPLLVVAGAVLVLRATQLGQAPCTDEGSYAALGYLLWNRQPGWPAPICTLPYIGLYPASLSWVFGFAGNGIVALRIADALVAAGCAAALYALLAGLAGRWLALSLSLLWVLCSNHPRFIQAGFKNPFAPGFACIILALLVASRGSSPRRSLFAGILLGVSFLLREPLVVFLLPVLAFVFLERGARPCALVAAGYAGAVAGGVALLALTQGVGPIAAASALLRNYREASVMYGNLVGAEGYVLRAHALAELRATLDVAAWAVPVWAAGGLLALRGLRERGRERALVVAGIILLLVPLPEFVLKLGFAYHLSACFLGLTVLAAVGLRRLGAGLRTAVGVAIVAIAVAFAPGGNGGNSLASWWKGVRDGCRVSLHYAPVMLGGDWTSPSVRDSFYLDTAYRILHHTRPGDRVLVSGFYTGLYPLTGRLPVRLDVIDASRLMLSRGLFRLGPEDRAKLNETLPALFVETNRFPGIDLKACFDRFEERFRQVDAVETGKSHYGQFACRLWKSGDGR
jgi:hypothetical protein